MQDLDGTSLSGNYHSQTGMIQRATNQNFNLRMAHQLAMQVEALVTPTAVHVLFRCNRKEILHPTRLLKNISFFSKQRNLIDELVVWHDGIKRHKMIRWSISPRLRWHKPQWMYCSDYLPTFLVSPNYLQLFGLVVFEEGESRYEVSYPLWGG